MSKKAMLGKFGGEIGEFCPVCQGESIMTSTMSQLAGNWSRKMVIPPGGFKATLLQFDLLQWISRAGHLTCAG